MNSSDVVDIYGLSFTLLSFCQGSRFRTGIALLGLLGRILCCILDSIGEMGLTFVWACMFVVLLGTLLFFVLLGTVMFVYGFEMVMPFIVSSRS